MAFCGIDVGTQGVRAVVVDAGGALLGEGAAPLPEGRRRGGEHTQDPASWWPALVTAVGHAVDRAGGGTAVDALALDATSGTILVEHADGSANGPALMYDDARAVAEAERVQDAGAELWSALGYRMQPTWALPKVVWLLGHDAVGPTDRIVHQADHLVGRLTGHAVATDVSTALKSGVDLRSVRWPVDVQDALGIAPGRLPRPVLPGTRLGGVGRDAAAATGLRVGTPIRAGMTDGCASQIASGALAPGRWCSALGTTLVVKGSTTTLLHDPSGAVYSHRHPDGGWLPGGASSTGAGSIAAAFPDADTALLTRLTEAAAASPVPATVAYPLRGQGERFPFVSADARPFGLTGIHDDAERFAAICTGVAYVERLAYDVLRSLGADVDGPVALTGGASRNAWWNQVRTDVLARPTTVPSSPQAAVGMAVLAAAEPGTLTATADRMVRATVELEPDPRRTAELHGGYRRLVGALADRGWLDAGLAATILADHTERIA